MVRIARLAVLVISLCAVGNVALAARPTAGEPLTFEQHIRPIFKAHCFHCHGGEGEAKAALDLRLKRLLLAGGESGPAIAPGKHAESLLYAKLESGEMPPTDKKLTAEELSLVAAWIDSGAATLRPEPESLEPGLRITPEERSFWSFQPIPAEVPIPAVNEGDRARTPIDAFLLARLREKGLPFSPEADKRTLLIRASLDLIGLPPSREELAAFLADESPDAYERAIDRLLDSPHYGERWGRYWLDVAGYADSEGYTSEDRPRPYIYKYRDYVIRAFNADMPLDRFITEQLAGDELIDGDLTNHSPENLDKLAATGYLRMAADGTASVGLDYDTARNGVMADTIKIVSTSLLGLSVGCAQCHDHRYDPIPQVDYYRLRAVFEPAYDYKNWRNPDQRLVSLWTDAERAKAAEVDAEVAVVSQERQAKEAAYLDEVLEAELAKLPEDVRAPLREAYKAPKDKLSDDQKKLLEQNPAVSRISGGVLYQYKPDAIEELKKIDARIAEIAAKKPPQDFIAITNEVPGNLPVTHLFHRGDHQQPKDAVSPGGLTVCSADGARLEIPADDPSLPTSGRRLAFARWIIGPDNPLTARVLANRVWLHHFGRGLVNTPADFGAMGEMPSHPELLDWLARDLMSGGWRLKRLHKLIMTSTAYRQASVRSEAIASADPEDRLLGRMPVRRLDAEAVRDRILAASGVLSDQLFGPAMTVKEDGVGQIVVEAAPPADRDPAGHDAFRRSVYVQMRRSQPLAMLHVFDQPVMETNCDRRVSSTVATQALMLMNSEFVLQQAGYFAKRVKSEAADDQSKQIQVAWQLAFGRDPLEAEATRAASFLAEQAQPIEGAPAPADGSPSSDPLVNLCQVLLSSNEFLYVE
jgi:mono/diheme cytochrome c family protein